jgi:hypothetical protein
VDCGEHEQKHLCLLAPFMGGVPPLAILWTIHPLQASSNGTAAISGHDIHKTQRCWILSFLVIRRRSIFHLAGQLRIHDKYCFLDKLSLGPSQIAV